MEALFLGSKNAKCTCFANNRGGIGRAVKLCIHCEVNSLVVHCQSISAGDEFTKKKAYVMTVPNKRPKFVMPF